MQDGRRDGKVTVEEADRYVRSALEAIGVHTQHPQLVTGRSPDSCSAAAPGSRRGPTSGSEPAGGQRPPLDARAAQWNPSRTASHTTTRCSAPPNSPRPAPKCTPVPMENSLVGKKSTAGPISKPSVISWAM